MKCKNEKNRVTRIGCIKTVAKKKKRLEKAVSLPIEQGPGAQPGSFRNSNNFINLKIAYIL